MGLLELSDDERERLSGGLGLDEPRMVGGARDSFDTGAAMEPQHGAVLPPPQDWEHPEYADMGLRRRPVGGASDAIDVMRSWEADPAGHGYRMYRQRERNGNLRLMDAWMLRGGNDDPAEFAAWRERMERELMKELGAIGTREALDRALRGTERGVPDGPAPQPESAPASARPGAGFAAMEDARRKAGFAFPEGGSAWDVEEYRRAVAARRGGTSSPAPGGGAVRSVPVTLAVAAPSMEEDPFA